MCGLAGELRLDGQRADVAALDRMTGVPGPPRARRRRAVGARPGGVRPPAAVDHRPVRARRPADGRPAPRAHRRLQRHRLQPPAAARRAGAVPGTASSPPPTPRSCCAAYAEWGTACVDRFLGMFAFAIVEHASGRLVLARDRLGIKPLYVDARPDRIRFASTVQALLAGGGVDTSIDRTALAHYMTFHSVVPAPRTILTGIRKLRRRPCASSSRTAPPATPSTGGRSSPATRPARLDRPRLGGGPARAAAHRRRPADGLRRAGRRAALRRHRLQPGRRAAGREGPDRPGDVQHRLRVRRRESGDEFEYSTLVAQRFGTDHHRIRIDDARLLPGIDAAVASMSEPMVSHDCVAFHLLSEDVSKHVKVVQSGQGADEVLGGYDWYPPLAGVARDGRRRGLLAGLLRPALAGDGRRPRAGVAPRRGRAHGVHHRAVRRSRARRPRSTPRCATTPRSCSSTTR